jgi:hypothetical protein
MDAVGRASQPNHFRATWQQWPLILWDAVRIDGQNPRLLPTPRETFAVDAPRTHNCTEASMIAQSEIGCLLSALVIGCRGPCVLSTGAGLPAGHTRATLFPAAA